METKPVFHKQSSRLAFIKLLLATVCLCLASPGAWAAAALAVVPSANFDSEGNAGNAIPFGNDVFCDDGIRYQQLYNGSEVSGPNIGSMAFRLDGVESDIEELTFTGVTVTLSSTLATQGTMSLTFLDNIGPDATVVDSGNLVVNPSVNTSPPNPFDFEIPFDTPFEFDGSRANLLVDIVIEGCQSAVNFTLDAVDGSPSITRIYAPDKDNLVAESGEGSGVSDYGLVTQFYVYSDGVVFVPYSMGAGGNWAIDGHNGEGFLFEPLPSGVVVIFWFTYDLFGDQMWLIGVSSSLDWSTDGLTGQDTRRL